MDNIPGLREALDLNAEWNKLDSSGMMVTGVFVARTDFIEQYPGFLSRFIFPLYKESVDWVSANPAEAAPIIERIGVAAADVAERAIPKCNITFIQGEEMKEILEAYLTVLFESTPESVGGVLPGEDFYYIP
jgi:NitT/TauT family transport system substrate-binding protein